MHTQAASLVEECHVQVSTDEIYRVHKWIEGQE